jgi:hypothetical protein
MQLSESREDGPGNTIQSEHQRLDVQFGEVWEAIEGEGSRQACALLRTALEVHFGQEENLYFPTLWRLRPDCERRLKGLLSAHSGFLSQLDATIESLDQGDRERARERFEELQSGFASHEIKEELVLKSIE